MAEITQHLGATLAVVTDAAAAARLTNERVATLSTAAGRIGAVVSLIQGIAAQTNLLALDATIEAARAGASGRGFAVVASEVKTLAQQTRQATEEIAGQIAAVQSETGEAVAAIGAICAKMEDVSRTTSIASAVEEQGVASAQISDNVHHAAQGVRHVAEGLTAVSRAADETTTSVAAAQGLSADTARRTQELGARIEGFLREVAAA